MTDQNSQKQILKQNPEHKVSRDILPSYLGKQVVLEVGDVGDHVCSGVLNRYDTRFLEITDFKQHKRDLGMYLGYTGNGGIEEDITSQDQVAFQLPVRTIAAGLVASIQTFEDILNTRPKK